MIMKIRNKMRMWGATEILWFAVLVLALGLIMAVGILPEAGVDTTPTSDDVNLDVVPSTGAEGFPVHAFCNDPDTNVRSFSAPDAGTTIQLLRVRNGITESVTIVLGTNDDVKIATHYFNNNDGAGQQDEDAYVNDEARECINKKSAYLVPLTQELEAAAAVSTGGPHPDIFTASGISNMQTLNPVTVKSKLQRTAVYRLVTMPGCSNGTLLNDLESLRIEAQKVNFNLQRNDSSYDFTVRINCGSSHIAICGSINIFCLGRGFPYVADVDISDILSQWPFSTRLSILLHEIMGHGVGTWNEQYCVGYETSGICYGYERFAPAPNWRDFMNTGELSRHGFEAGGVELLRWGITMYSLIQVPPPPPTPCEDPIQPNGMYYNRCTARWYNDVGWSYDPAVRVWYTPAGRATWGECNLVDRACWHIPSEDWAFDGSRFYYPRENLHYTLPLG